MQTKTRQADVQLTKSGNVWLFRPLSERAGEWFDKHVITEDWQWVGGTLVVEHCAVQSLLFGLSAQDFLFDVR